MTPEGETTVTISAVDGADRTHSRTIELDADTDKLLVRRDKAVYAAGDEAVLRITSASGADRVFVDVFHGVSGLAALALSMENGVAEAHIPISDELSGVLVFDAFSLGDAGKVLSGSARALVSANDRLNVRMTSSQPTFAPGQEAQLTVEVTDAAGHPKAARSASMASTKRFLPSGVSRKTTST